MSGVNKVILLGRLGQEPEIRYTGSGTAVCNLSVATSESWMDKATNEKKEKTEWHRVSVWGKLAELCNQHLSKGRQVYLEGKLETRSWDDEKTGDKKYSTEIKASTVQFIGEKQEGPKQASEPPVNNNYSADNIPF